MLLPNDCVRYTLPEVMHQISFAYTKDHSVGIIFGKARSNSHQVQVLFDAAVVFES